MKCASALINSCTIVCPVPRTLYRIITIKLINKLSTNDYLYTKLGVMIYYTGTMTSKIHELTLLRGVSLDI